MSSLRIAARDLSKLYRISGKRERYKTLRDHLSKAASNSLRRLAAVWQRGDRSEANGANTFWALKDVSFEINAGEVVGIVGRNGAGKTTLLKLLARITEPTTGHAEIHGRVGSLLEVGTGFHPELSGRENVFLNGAILGMKKAETARKFDEIVAFAEIDKFIDTPVKHYSSGMYMRLAFSVAAHLEPEILLVDEVLAVGDVVFQKKCLGKMDAITQEGRTVLFVSHNMAAVRSLCAKGILLNQGSLLAAGDIGGIIEQYYQQIGALRNGEDGGDAPNTRFGQIKLNNSDGNTVLQSQELDVSTTLKIDEEIGGFSLYCCLEDVNGANIFHLREESTLLGYERDATGRFVIRVVIPPLWLNPGLYSLYFKVLFWGEYGSARHVSDKLLLDITGTSSMSKSILHPHADWTFKEAVSESPSYNQLAQPAATR
jgi:lipopolysaccharide transport system ATP-binding protein